LWTEERGANEKGEQSVFKIVKARRSGEKTWAKLVFFELCALTKVMTPAPSVYLILCGMG